MKKLLILAATATLFAVSSCKKEETATPTPVVEATASFNYLGTQNFAPAAIQFTSTSTNAISYLWDFGDNDTSSLQNPTHTFALGGVYTVKLTVKNSAGVSNSTTKTLNIKPAPTKVLLKSVVLNGISLTSSSGGGWDIGSGPDIYFAYGNDGVQINKSLNVYNDVLQSTFPLAWNLSTAVDWAPLNSTTAFISFYDEDNTTDELMDGFTINLSQLSTFAYPTQIPVKLGALDAVITIAYQ